VSDTTPPTAPANLTATGVSNSQINLGWSAATDNVGVAGYRVERCQGAGCNSFVQIGTTPANVAQYTDSGLPQGVVFGYRVRAFNSAGEAAYTNVAYGTTLVSIPNPPGGLQATPLSPTSALLQWENPDGVAIRLTRAAMQGSGDFAAFEFEPAQLPRYIDTGLRKNTTYCYSMEPIPAPEDYWTQTECLRTPNR
jgi:hypothetical protein